MDEIWINALIVSIIMTGLAMLIYDGVMLNKDNERKPFNMFGIIGALMSLCGYFIYVGIWH